MDARGVRISWEDLPDRVHAAVADLLGAPVVAAVSQPSGFSPGSADRVRAANGRRAFVKAVTPALNQDAATLHRREIGVTGALPPETPAPRLLGSYDDGEWVAIVLEDVAGRHPQLPWVRAELDAVLTACHELAEQLTPAPATLTRGSDGLVDNLLDWDRVSADPPADLDPWAAANLGELRALGRLAGASIAGNTLAHTDLRADNILLRADGSVVFVDWPWAMRAVPWLDTLLVLINANYYGSRDVDDIAAEHCATSAESVTAVIAGLAGFLTNCARKPPPPGLPTLRAFQQAQAETTLGWVRRRLS